MSPRSAFGSGPGGRGPAGVALLLAPVALALLLAPAALAQQGGSGGAAPSSAASPEDAKEGAEADGSGESAEPVTPEIEKQAELESSATASGAGEEDPSTTQAVEEFLVTAQKIEVVVPDTTISVIGFDPEAIRTEGIKDIRDLSNFTPSLDIKSAFAATNPTIFIRGVGLDDYNANAANAVAIYQDGIYMASPAGQLFQFYDVDNVEVLRGPQPTLFRNAEAGAILLRSKPPGDELDGYLQTTYGRFNEIDVEGALGGPIVPGWLSGRLSGTWGMRDGITKNRCANNRGTFPCDQQAQTGDLLVEAGMDTYTNDVDAYAARGQLLFKPPLDGSEMEWLLNAHGGQNLSRALQYAHRGVRFFAPGQVPGCNNASQEPECRFVPRPLDPSTPDSSGYADADGDPFAGDYNIDGPEDLSVWGTNLRGTWRLGDYELGSLTGYEWHDRHTVENSDANPRFLEQSTYDDNAWQVSQEFDLRGDWNVSETGEGSWVLGAYYLQEDLEVHNFFDILSGTDLDQHYTQKTRNFAAYAWSEYRLLPGCEGISCDFTFVSGIRYNVEYKKFDTDVCSVAGTGCNIALEGSDDSLWNGIGGEASIAWNFNETSSVYAKYSHGWKGGHFNGGAVTPFDVITSVDPESVDSYELGLRSFWYENRIMLNLTGFYYSYDNLQVFVLEQTPVGFQIPKLENAKSATGYGVELDLAATPIDDLTLTYNFSWVHTRYNDFSVSLPFTFRPPREPGQPPQPQTQVLFDFDYSGNPLIAAPEYAMTGSVAYDVHLPEVLGWAPGTLTPYFSFSWRSVAYFDASGGRGALVNFPEGTFGQEPYWVLNAALTWRSENKKIEVIGWVHNFLDQYYKTQSFDLTRGFNVLLDAYADPRTYGVTVTYNF